jgi:hypothetical protein
MAQVGDGIFLIGRKTENLFHKSLVILYLKIYNITTHTETMMFTPEFFIDTIQTTKKTVFNRIVQDPELQKVAERYINTQTDFAKMLVSNAIDLAKYSLDKCSPQKEQASQAPYKVEKEAE